MSGRSPAGGRAGRHGVRELFGYGILVGIVLSWVGTLWLGLTLAFLSDPNAVVDASTQQPASSIARAGYAMGALAGAGASYVAGNGWWVLLNNAGAVLGLGAVTLTLTYLFQVVSATSHKRALALQILCRGLTPPLRRAIDEYLETAPLAGGAEAPPVPDLSERRDADLDLPDRQCLHDAFARQADRRSRLRGLVERSGWQWQGDVG